MRLPLIAFAVPVALALAAPGTAAEVPAADAPEWKAGAASVQITPKESMWMAGYAARNKPSEGVAADLYAKALALEDREGRRLVIVTLDLIGVPRGLRDWMEKEVHERHKLPRESLLMNASHTHCGPELRLERMARTSEPQQQQRVGAAYLDELKKNLLAVVDEAIGKLAPARLDYLHARAGFAMNRRRPTDKGYSNAPYSDGPVDHDVPVLRVTAEDGKLRAALFGYACHNTNLSFYKFCGDYAGFAQEAIQEAHPEALALFMAGCGADQNPYPRGTEDWARLHGRTLAGAVEAALQTVPKPVRGPLRASLEEVAIEFAPPPPREELEKMAQGTREPDRGHAKRLLEQIERDGKLRADYPYLVQVVRFGDDLTLVALAGEVVVDYSLGLKRELAGPAVWIAGYSNDVFGYVPSARVLKEGGYEAGGAARWGSLPGGFAETIEERIVGKVLEMARQPAVKPPEKPSESKTP